MHAGAWHAGILARAGAREGQELMTGRLPQLLPYFSPSYFSDLHLLVSVLLVCMVSTTCMQRPWRPAKGIGSAGTGITRGCVIPGDAGNLTLVLCNSSKRS